jgi:hypothetical protein
MIATPVHARTISHRCTTVICTGVFRWSSSDDEFIIREIRFKKALGNSDSDSPCYTAYKEK